ncbi:MAG: helix-turn-helix domain-containing protein [Lachnospiraceae bacterium]|nr:helix-turn-helix domain-containing protein [Lachnospiraceae bacterium]
MNIAEVIMNPVRQRIIQFLMVHDKGTVKEIGSELNDVPTPSLYRHVKILAENAVIVVVEENRIRGTVESVYQLNPNALAVEDDDGLVVQASLLSICISFAKYFADDHADPRRDMLSLTGCTLMLTDDEFKEFLARINDLTMDYIIKEPAEGASPRQVTLISSPCK